MEGSEHKLLSEFTPPWRGSIRTYNLASLSLAKLCAY